MVSTPGVVAVTPGLERMDGWMDGIILTAGMHVCAMCLLSLTAVDGTSSLSVKSGSRVQDHRCSCKFKRGETNICPGLILMSELHQRVLFLFAGATSFPNETACVSFLVLVS